MKTETKHTPGPWMVRYQLEFGGKLTIVAGNNQARKTLATIEHIAARTEQESNARLIAAAPEMLEALYEAKTGLYQAWIMAKDLRDRPLIDHCSKLLSATTATIAKVIGAIEVQP